MDLAHVNDLNKSGNTAVVNITGVYHIRTNIGEELNLMNWQIVIQSPSLNLANIFSIAYQL